MRRAPAPPAAGGRVPPHNLEAEASVLGSLMLDRNAIVRVADFLRPEDFYLDHHAQVYRAALNLYDRSDPIDLLTLASELEKMLVLDRIGGQVFLAELESRVPTAANVEYYGHLVEEAATKRKLISAGGRITALGFDDSTPAGHALDAAESVIFNIAEGRITQDFVILKDILKNTWDQIEAIHKDQSTIIGVPSGFNDLDAKTGGFQKSDLIMIAGRPGQGKTSLVLNVAQNAAIQYKVPVAIFSLEMSEQQLVTRLLCSEASVDSYRLRTGLLKDAEWPRIAQAMGALSEAQIYIDDSPGLSVMEMRTKARRLKAANNLGLIIVDYLQLMQGRSSENRVQEVSDISRSLKSLARELQVPVIACSQLSREPEKRPDHRPQLSDLRESGCLAGETLVYLPDLGMYKPISELVGMVGFRVLGLNTGSWKLEPHAVTNAFSTGRKPVFKVTTQRGRSVRATTNHKFLTIDGWRRLDELSVGTRVALPRSLPGPDKATMGLAELALLGHLIGDGCTLPRHAIQYTTNDETLAKIVADLATEVFGDKIRPRITKERDWYQVYLAAAGRLTHGVHNPVVSWLKELGVFGLRSFEKRVPDQVFLQPSDRIAHFLRHLWSTDGSIHLSHGIGHYANVYFASSSQLLAKDVQRLLLRIGIDAAIGRYAQPNKGRDQFHVRLRGRSDIEWFLSGVGALGKLKVQHKAAIAEFFSSRRVRTRDFLPVDIWSNVALPALEAVGVSRAALGTALGARPHYDHDMGRELAGRIAVIASSEELARLADSDVLWDRVISIQEDGVADVYDLTVDAVHNFVAADTVLHNSLEQDSDLVLFIYRERFYNDNVAEDRRNIAEIIIAKHRNGPTGKLELLFIDEQTKFANLDRRRGS
ncbi:MAG: replicative DNA helicase [Cyanobacteria bacterium 13_1_40CM_2_61_4]|nr:MAG: replicative DNA helicase [Cyanobacteria bacterium 13_1_40CM_2_61_4]